jgi:hypothetical protein
MEMDLIEASRYYGDCRELFAELHELEETETETE